MGRGLSPLQKWILQRASETDWLSATQIIHEYYGVPLSVPLSLPTGNHFEGDNAVTASKHRAAVSRAFARLVARGLVETGCTMLGRNASVSLTPAGRSEVRNNG